MNIIEKVKQSIEAVDVPFYYASAETLNTILDDAEFPAAVSVLLEQGTATDENGIYRERITLYVSFCNLTEFDFDSIKNEDIIDECKRKAFQWLSSLRLSAYLNIISINSTTRDYVKDDVILTGFGVNVTLEEVDGVGVCDFYR